VAREDYTYDADSPLQTIFSPLQFTQVLNILQVVLNKLNTRYLRLDGSTKVDERQAMVDEFTEDEDIKVFLLSTRAGGMG
jgi:SWI/SNF-related matrix-associated actin-dependent regulator 1 of chromatin subfamily A